MGRNLLRDVPPCRHAEMRMNKSFRVVGLSILLVLCLCRIMACGDSEKKDDRNRPNAPVDDDATADDDAVNDDDDDSLSDDDDDDNDDDDDDDDDNNNDDPGTCPENMVLVRGGRVNVIYYGQMWGGQEEVAVEQEVESFCIDKYEVSQPDATVDDEGSWFFGEDLPAASCAAGVLPWRNIPQADAALACAMAGKRLPTLAEWQLAFSGYSGKKWPWGDAWDGVMAADCYFDMPFVGEPIPVYPTGGCCFTIPAEEGGPFEICDMVGSLAEWLATPWSPECYGEEQVCVAGGASRKNPYSVQSQREDPENPGCYLFVDFAGCRYGLHHHAAMDAPYDDGFRCATEPLE